MNTWIISSANRAAELIIDVLVIRLVLLPRGSRLRTQLGHLVLKITSQHLSRGDLLIFNEKKDFILINLLCLPLNCHIQLHIPLNQSLTVNLQLLQLINSLRNVFLA